MDRRSEVTRVYPLLEIFRVIETDLVLLRKRDCHDPAVALLIPANARIAEVSKVQIEHRILLVFLPVTAVVQAVGQILGLPMTIRCIAIAGIDGNEALLDGLAKTAP